MASEQLKLEAFERAKAMMGAQYAKDKELLERDEASQSGESFIYEQARLIAYSHLDDEDEDFSAREIDDLLAREEKDPVRRVALKLICAEQLRNGELLPCLQEWLPKFLERETPVSVGRGRSPKHMSDTDMQAYMIGMTIAVAEDDDLVKKSGLRATRNQQPKHDPEAERKREKRPKLSLCDAMQAALGELGEHRSYDYVVAMRRRFRHMSKLA